MICGRIAESITGITAACRELISDGQHVPAPRTLFAWVSEDEQLAEMLSIAKRQQAQNIVDKLTELTEAAEHAQKDAVPGLRLASDNLKWLAERLAPEWSTKIVATDTKGQDVVHPIFSVTVVKEMPSIEGEFSVEDAH